MNMKLFEDQVENVGEGSGRHDRDISCWSSDGVLCPDWTDSVVLLFPSHQGSLCEEHKPNQVYTLKNFMVIEGEGPPRS